MVAGKTGESGDICGRNLKKSTTMEIMTIESNAYRLLVEKIEKITAYVEESRNREETERKRKEEAESPAAKGRKADPKWMTHKEVCEMLDISHRTLQRYRQKHIIPYSMIGRQIRYPRQAVESLRERWMVETPAAKVDRMIAEHPLHNRKNGSYGKKGRDINPAKRKAMAVKNEKRFLKQKRNALKNPGYSRHPVKTQASFKRLLKAV